MKQDQWKEISNLYHAALELPKSERATFLQTCIASDAMRREVESLLANEGEGEALLQSSALEAVARMAAKRNPMLAVGSKLGPYEIVAPIGAGGMGEVYRARDPRVGREVAIKVSAELFNERFEPEVRAVAALNHPNICTLHDVGSNYLVMELVEGLTLTDRIKQGAIPLEESLTIARQIANALEAAHEKGIVHRDLKPGNIKIKPDGTVKVLDFGLAKIGEVPAANIGNSPTLGAGQTITGTILGTAAYMSPEQARGKSVDRRADIWAFGCVLYEMLTGRAAFQGEDVSEILASVIKGDVKLDLLPVNVHPRVREVLTRCLQKDVRRRYWGISDALYEIEQALADSKGEFVQPVTAEEPWTKWRLRLPWIAASIILTAIVAGVAVWNLKPTPSLEPRHVMRFDYQLPEGQQFSPGSGLLFNPGSALAVSPDGRQFAYATPKGLYLRSLDESASKLIAGTEGNTRQPFFSPDGKWIGYYSAGDSKLKKIAVNGGVPVALCDVPQFMGASWSEDNTIVYGQDPGGIMRISGNGGTSECLVKAKSAVLEYPQILPDRKSVLYTAQANPYNTGSARIVVQGEKPGEPKELFAGYGAQYLPTGDIVYRQGDNIFVIPFNPARLEVTGGTVGVGETLSDFAVSDAGTLVYYAPQPLSSAATPLGNTLVWVSRDGNEEPIAAPPKMYVSPKISPDGTRITLSVWNAGDQTFSIQIWDLARKTLTRLTSGEKQDLVSIWTPDGKRIIFSSGLLGTNTLCWKAADGTGEAEKLASVPGRLLMPWSISSDGKNLAIEELMGTRFGIAMMSMEGGRALKWLLHDEKNDEIQPKISPNGKWMAYDSAESGQNEVYVRSFPDVEKTKFQVSMNGGNYSLWSPNGRELFYLSNENSVMATAVQTEPTFSLGTTKVLFKSTCLGNALGHPWDISPDGKRFLMIKPLTPTVATPQSPAPQPKINIVLNWFEELKQRAPGK